MDMLDETLRDFGVSSMITSFPGSSRVVVFHSVWSPDTNRGRGNGTKAHRERLRKAREWGYEYAICTVRSDNAVQHRILAQHGWKVLSWYGSGNQKMLLYGKALDVPLS